MSVGRLTILGCGSAKPTKNSSPSGQFLELCDKAFLIDCGEGAQLAIQQLGLHTNRLYSIFISHLHGDHCFGLIGLLTTLDMLKRTQPMHIYAHPDLEKLMRPLLDYYCPDCHYEIVFHPINPRKHETIFEDRTLRVETIPLKHGVPSCGFLFVETHRVQREDGSFEHVSHRRFAYCSDTKYNEAIVPLIEGVDLLFHESTFLTNCLVRARLAQHSTAAQAAQIAAQANVGQLLLGHYSSRVEDHQLFLEEAKPIFEKSILSADRMQLEF